MIDVTATNAKLFADAKDKVCAQGITWVLNDDTHVNHMVHNSLLGYSMDLLNIPEAITAEAFIQSAYNYRMNQFKVREYVMRLALQSSINPNNSFYVGSEKLTSTVVFGTGAVNLKAMTIVDNEAFVRVYRDKKFVMDMKLPSVLSSNQIDPKIDHDRVMQMLETCNSVLTADSTMFNGNSVLIEQPWWEFGYMNFKNVMHIGSTDSPSERLEYFLESVKSTELFNLMLEGNNLIDILMTVLYGFTMKHVVPGYGRIEITWNPFNLYGLEVPDEI